MMRWLLPILIVANCSLRAGDDIPSPTDELQQTISIPLTDGRIDFGTVLANLAEEMGLDAAAIKRQVDRAVDVEELDSSRYEKLTAVTKGVISFEHAADELTVRFDCVAMRRQSKEIRGGFRQLVAEWFPEAAAAAAKRYGVFACTPDNFFNPLDCAELPEHVVLLVHGVDDTGRVWNDVIPALYDADYYVCRLEYPNDQPIANSAKFLAANLERLKGQGVRHVSLVVHSMGGLVSREMLTSPDLYNGAGSGHAQYPDVEHLIMVGTPNRGAEIARLRAAAEVRDQVVRLFSGNGVMFGGIFDGAGEAKLDLLPDSVFLATLNGRPHPAGVDMLVLAGRASPFDASDVKGFMSKVRASISEDLSGQCDRFEASVSQLVHGVGDGAVSLEATKLDGIERIVLPANHMTLIRRLIPSAPLPLGIPIILDRLQ